MLLTYTGRESGRTYTTPDNYVREGDDLLRVGSREHAWWRNLRGGQGLLALVLAYRLKRTGSLWACVVCHAMRTIGERPSDIRARRAGRGRALSMRPYQS